eukprot:9834499-Lingulodinium_polyedra.AAC.1
MIRNPPPPATSGLARRMRRHQAGAAGPSPARAPGQGPRITPRPSANAIRAAERAIHYREVGTNAGDSDGSQ